MPQNLDIEPLAGYRADVGLLLAALEDSTREWRGDLGDPSIDAIVWQPHPGSHSIGGILLHSASVELHWFDAFLARKTLDPEELKILLTNETDVEHGIWPTPPAHTIAWYYEIHNDIRKRVFESLKEVDPDSRFDRGAYSITLRWVLAHVVQHDSYHGGQAVLLHELWKKQQDSNQAELQAPAK